MDDNPTQPAATEAEPVGRGWFLSREELAATRVKLDKLRRRATRRGFTGTLDLEAVPASRTQTTPGGLDVTVHGFEVTILGTPPSYAGWRFVAAVDDTPGGAIVRYPPGSTSEVANAEVRAGECDHCHTRRTRRSTILVEHEHTGQLLKVGRSCVKDFLGHHLFPVFFTDEDVADRIRASGSFSSSAWDTLSVLTYAAAAVEAFGWTPASLSGPGRVSTKELVRVALAGGRGADDIRRGLAPHLEAARASAPAIRAELLVGLTDGTGYQANLAAVLRSDAVEARHLGLAVSAITAHQRLQEDSARDAAAAREARVVEYAGAVGDKVTLTGVVRTHTFVAGYTEHAPDRVFIVLDCGTSVAKMTTAAGWAHPVRVGDPLTLTATVKAHGEWNGVKQTVLTRPKLVTPAPDPPPAVDAAPGWESVQPRPHDHAGPAGPDPHQPHRAPYLFDRPPKRRELGP